MKHILLANDDGIDAPGLAALYALFSAQKDMHVHVIAPDGQRSAGGHAITLWSSISLRDYTPDRIAISGTPADCVKLAEAYISEPIDLVVSGINNGQNMGADIYYSGTVAAAREAAIYGVPGMAVSLSTKDPDADYSAAAEYALKYARVLFEHPLPKGTLLNVNIPNLPADKIRGVKLARLGRRVYKDSIDPRTTPFGQRYCWRICKELSHTPYDGGDIDAVEAGYVALTPVKLDATDYESAHALAKALPSVILDLG
jgi:5'-nucleotidase